MDGQSPSFLEALDARATEIADACTACGACVRVCPTTGPAHVDVSDPTATARGVIDLLRGGPGNASAEAFASSCSLSGDCIDACEYGINPRFMLSLARRAMKDRVAPIEARRAGVKSYLTMSRGVKVLSRLQLPPEMLVRLGQSGEAAEAADAAPPDVVFYTGCNILKTPHIALLALDILDALEVTYRVVGGPKSCCGVLHQRAGDTKAAGRMAGKTIAEWADIGASEVVSWCATCQVQFSEGSIPTYERVNGPVAFDMNPFLLFLDRNLDRLAPMMTVSVPRRVAVHTLPGNRGVTAAAYRILAAVPGLEVVDLGRPQVGLMSNYLDPIPGLRQEIIGGLADAAEAAGVGTLVSVYHGCHRQMTDFEVDRRFEVVNILELIGDAMGVHETDVFKRLKFMRDADAIMADAGELIAANGLDPAETRDVVLKEMVARS